MTTIDRNAYVDVGLRKPHTVYFNDRIFETADLSKLETTRVTTSGYTSGIPRR